MGKLLKLSALILAAIAEIEDADDYSPGEFIAAMGMITTNAICEAFEDKNVQIDIAKALAATMMAEIKGNQVSL